MVFYEANTETVFPSIFTLSERVWSGGDVKLFVIMTNTVRRTVQLGHLAVRL